MYLGTKAMVKNFSEKTFHLETIIYLFISE